MIVSCGRCKYQGEIYQYYDWFKVETRSPQLWLCDVCAQEVTR